MLSSIGVLASFDAAHRLPTYSGKCFNLHGHTYRVKVRITGVQDPATGMVMDFFNLKGILLQVLEEVDHRTLLWKSDFLVEDLLKVLPNGCIVVLEEQPTVEYLVRYLAKKLRKQITSACSGVQMVWVRLHETPDCWAEISL